MTNRSGRLGAGDSLTPLGQILPFVRPGTAVGRPGPAVASASGPAPSPPASRPVLAQAPPWTPLSAPGYRLGRGGPERLLACEGCGVQDWYPRNVTPRCGGCLAELAAQRQAEAEARQLAAGGLGSIPTRYRGLQFGSPDLAARVAVPRAISVAQQLAPLEQFPVVLITGGAGRGKTSLGTAILRWHIDRGEAPGATEEEQVWGQRVLWTSAEAVATSWRNKTARLLERAHAASVLLLDDLGQEPPAEQSDLTALLRARHADCRPTIATWGFALAELSRYGASIERRFTDAQAARLDLGAARAS